MLEEYDKNIFQNISVNWINQQMAVNGVDFVRFMDGLYEPRFSVSKLGITRQELLYWKKKGVISPSDSESKTWARLSFFEYCWVRLVVEFRKMNISIDTIAKLRKNLFDFDEELIIRLLKQQIENNDKSGVKNEVLDQKDFRDFIYAMPDHFKKEMRKTCNYFMLILLGIIIDKRSCSLLFKMNGDFSVLIPGTLNIKEVQREFIEFSCEPFMSFPIQSILDEFYTSEKIKISEIKDIFQLTEKEAKILAMLKREGLKEIRIRMNNKGKGELLVELIEEKQIDIMKDKVERLLKKDEIQDIRIKTEKGRLLYFEETTKLKI